MERTTWQVRIRAAGLSQRALMRLTGHSENTISRQMKGLWPVTRHVAAIVIAWEMMTPEQRREWTQRLGQEP